MPLPGIERHHHASIVLGAATPPGGRPSHAYLFHGPAGSGKQEIASAFAAELLADGSKDPDNVRARVERRIHPDLTWVEPSGAHELLTADITEPVVAAASRTPFEARRRVFVIEKVDTMNDESANRMLKTLEEPASFVHLILLTEKPGEVMETIASRCQHVRFDPPPAGELARRLSAEGVDPATAEACARLASGDEARARALAVGDGPKLRAAAERLARSTLHAAVAGRPWRDLSSAARARGEAVTAELDAAFAESLELLAKRDRKKSETEHTARARRVARRASTGTLDLGLALVEYWYRDLACIALDAPDLVATTDRRAELESDAEGRDPVALRRAIELVEDTRKRLLVNVDEDLALEALAYRLEVELGG
jgi:DNA polymerase III subunit delta'